MQSNLSEQVATDIRDKILNRVYPPNSQIPNEYELAQQYDVCRYTIREAIKKLVAIGLVTVERGKGTFVNDKLVSSYFDSVIEKLVLIDRDVEEIFEARIAIETKTASLAAQNAKPEEVEQMKKLSDQMREALNNNDFEQYNLLDLKFHECIASASKNRILIEVLIILYDMIAYALDHVPTTREKCEFSISGHDRIFKAIEARQPQKAGQEMCDHLDFCKKLSPKEP